MPKLSQSFASYKRSAETRMRLLGTFIGLLIVILMLAGSIYMDQERFNYYDWSMACKASQMRLTTVNGHFACKR